MPRWAQKYNDMIANSLEGILADLSTLSNSNKRWLAEHLMEQVEEKPHAKDPATTKLIEDIFAIPADYQMSAEQHMEMIRSTRQSGVTRPTFASL